MRSFLLCFRNNETCTSVVSRSSPETTTHVSIWYPDQVVRGLADPDSNIRPSFLPSSQICLWSSALNRSKVTQPVMIGKSTWHPRLPVRPPTSVNVLQILHVWRHGEPQLKVAAHSQTDKLAGQGVHSAHNGLCTLVVKLLFVLAALQKARIHLKSDV